LILPILLFANSDIRKQFHKGLKNKAEIEKIIKSLEVKTTKSAVELGYLGASKMVYAQFYVNPYNKLKSFKEGKLLLENAINEENKNPELIYLRYICSVNAPKFLNYNKNIQNDHLFLESSLKNIADSELKSLILSILKK
jgi:hypothetical protein